MTVKPYDPADSPGPIPSVVERFRPRRTEEDTSTGAAAEIERYTVVLVPPETAEAIGLLRDDPGLKLYLDNDWDCDLASLDEAARLIKQECDVAVTLVEHHADLTYWTARLRDPADVSCERPRSSYASI
ncbi:hypothetical protein [Micromonospora zhanjiangensis]|uniref:Uncharacterized protein n=1 Tax=Micromonospora zhanjiangensis TaxID=1522057 RepID=A0ABV8KJZ6_9ACTN